MASERFVTPEKQLLRLIEDQKAPQTAGVKVHAAKHHGMSYFSLSAWAGRTSYLKDSFRKWIASGGYRQLDIKLINNIFAAAAAVLIFYLVINLIFHIISVSKPPDIKMIQTDTVKQLVSAKDMSVLKSGVSYYLEKMRQRDIFKIGETGPGPSSVRQAEKKETPKIVEAMQHLQLVGISWSNDPDAMIEDTRVMKTFFVKKGQMVGDLDVRAIFKDKVILGLGDAEGELK